MSVNNEHVTTVDAALHQLERRRWAICTDCGNHFPMLPREHPAVMDAMVRRALRHTQLTSIREAFDRLSPRERAVAVALSRGMMPADIARWLRIAPKTVGTFRQRAMDKLQLSTTAELAVAFDRAGLNKELPVIPTIGANWFTGFDELQQLCIEAIAGAITQADIVWATRVLRQAEIDHLDIEISEDEIQRLCSLAGHQAPPKRDLLND